MYKREKRILMIDVSFLFDQYALRGIGRYGKEVVSRIVKNQEDFGWEIHLLGFNDLKSNLRELGLTPFAIEEIQDQIKFSSLGKPTKSDIYNIFRFNKIWKPLIKEVDPDMFFALHFERGLPSTEFINNGIIHIPTIVATHDVIPLINNSFSSKGYLQNNIKKMFYKFMFSGVKLADVVLTPSEHSKKDLVEYGKVDESKIAKVFAGIDKSFFKEEVKISIDDQTNTLKGYSLFEKDYFFYDSGIEANKGIDNLLQIFAKLSEIDEMPQNLVVVGGDFTKGEGYKIKPKSKNAERFLQLARELNILPRIITTNRISDEELLHMLFSAKLYIYLSSYEGFGFGPLQAMAAKIPAIVSNTSCLPEITNGGALLIDPTNIDTSISQIREFVATNAFSQERLEMANNIAKDYDWEKTINKIMSLLDNLYNKFED